MAIVKLVCQGCGANLDVSDDRRVVACGYCGTNNQLKQTVAPQPPPPQPPSQPFHHQPPVQVSVPQPQNSGSGRGILIFVLIMALLPLALGGFITYMVTRTTKEVFDRVGLGGGGSNVGGGEVGARRYRWASGRPFVADVNGDGTDDILGTIQETSSQQLLLTAMSGSDYATLWEVDLGRLADLPNPILRHDAQAKLLLFQLGPTLHAYDAGSGSQRWVANFPDKVEDVTRDGDHLWVSTIDESGHAVDPGSGKVTPAEPKPGAGATPLRDDAGYDLIPSLRSLDLKSNQFEGLRVEQAFCPKQALPVGVGRGHRDGVSCSHPRGLAFATRDKGTQIPFLVGYDRTTKAELWRVQLTKAGSLETVDSGFAQPRAELVGDDAIVSFSPASDDDARIRRISLTDGSTKWETRIVRTSTENVDGMVAGDNRVFVTYGQSIRAIALDSGQELAKLGGF